MPAALPARDPAVTRLAVPLPRGEATVTLAWEEPAADAGGVVVLAHGAGAGMDHPFLVGFAGALRAAGFATVRFSFPYAEAGRRMPGPAAHAVATWAAVATEVARVRPQDAWVAAGKSYGGRMASLAAADGLIAPAGLVYLGYPFHPPGVPGRTRGEHLARVRPPQLFVEGGADPFIQPTGDFTAAVATSPDAEIVWIPGGGHSFEVAGARRAPEEVGGDVAASVLPWLRARI